MNNICVVCGKKEIQYKGMCSSCYNRRHYKQYCATHPEYHERYKSRNYVCNTLKKHAAEMKDDPEHLTTEFLQDLIGIKCKKDVSKDKNNS